MLQNLKKKLIILQKKAIRNLCNTGYREHTQPLFKKLNCLKFEDMVYLKTAVIMYKASNDLLPANVQCVFRKVNSVHRYSTRQQNDLYVQQVNSSMRKNSISYIGVQIWNKLDHSFKSSNSVHFFKKQLKMHIIKQY